MTGPTFTSAVITHDGLATSWADVPSEGAQDTLLLSLIVQRADGSEVRFGGSWVRDAADSPVVFAWDGTELEAENVDLRLEG